VGRVVDTRDARLWTPGGGGTLRDALTFHPALFLAAKAVWWLIKRPWRALAVLGSVYAGVTIDYRVGIVVAGVAVVVMYLGGVIWSARGCSPASPEHVVKGAWRRQMLLWQWDRACEAMGLTGKGRDRGQAVPLSRVRIVPYGLDFEVRLGAVGHTVDEFRKVTDTLCAILGCEAAYVRRISATRCAVHATWGDATTRVITLQELPRGGNSELALGVAGDGGMASVKYYLSCLVTGLPGSGKSNTIWVMLHSLIEQGIPYRLRIIDPAGGVELSRLDPKNGSVNVKYYTSKGGKEAEKVIEQARDSMFARLSDMSKRGVRTHEPTVEEPLDITIIDELLLIQVILKKGADSPLAELLSIGRKARYVVWGMSQLTQVDAIGRVRDLFPQRLCYATKSREMTEASLGQGAEGDGAKCSRITEDEQGVGYQYRDGKRGYQRYRAAFVTDQEADLIAKGVLPDDGRQAQVAEMLTRADKWERDVAQARTAVYQYPLKDQERIGYVGIAINPNERLKEHYREDMWMHEIDVSRITVEWFPNRDAAKKRETQLIKQLQPPFNVKEAVLVGEVVDPSPVRRPSPRSKK
jgi:predicted GIY-YIG superfamily endonuclease